MVIKTKLSMSFANHAHKILIKLTTGFLNINIQHHIKSFFPRYLPYIPFIIIHWYLINCIWIYKNIILNIGLLYIRQWVSTGTGRGDEATAWSEPPKYGSHWSGREGSYGRLKGVRDNGITNPALLSTSTQPLGPSNCSVMLSQMYQTCK